MSARGRNHTRGTMQAWRQMARADGGKVPRRWRWWVRALAKRNGWTFSDGYLHTLYGGGMEGF